MILKSVTTICCFDRRPLNKAFSLMVCFHCPTPIPILILIPIPMELASIVMCRTVSTELTPIPMPMGTVPILAPTSVLIRCNLTSFHCNFCIGIGPSGALLHTIGIGTIIGIGIGVGQWKHTITTSRLYRTTAAPSTMSFRF